MQQNNDPIVHSLDSFTQKQEKVKEQIMSTRLTPKKAQEEHRRILMQTAFFIFLAVVLGLALILFVIPGLIRLAGAMTGITNPANSDTVAPRVPIYSAPAEATNQSTLTMEGYGEPESTIVLVQNGSKAEELQADAEGNFSFSIDLSQGENMIAFYSVDEAGNESSVGREYTVIYDTEAPTLEWENPADATVVTNLRERQVSVQGKVSEGGNLYLNDRLVFADSEGNFSTTFQLVEGENTLTLKAVDEAGNETEESRTVSFRP